MNITVDHDVFTEAVTWVARTIPNRPAVLILSGLKIVAAEDGTISLESRDSDITSHIEIEGNVIEAGEVLVNGKLLADICRALPNMPIELKIDGGKLDLECGPSRFSLTTMAGEDYSDLPQMPEVTGVVDGNEWEKAVSQVTIAASTDDTLPMLVSVCIEIEGDKLSLMATDRYRLAIRDMDWQVTDPELKARILVRASRLSEVAKSLGSAGPVEISLQQSEIGSFIGFSAGGRQATIQLIDGDYPQVRSLFPEEVSGNIVMERRETLDAIKRSRIVVEKNAAVRLTFGQDDMVLEAGQGDRAQVSEVLPASLSGEAITMAFNPVFLQEGLSVIDQDQVRLAFTHPTKPAVMTGEKDGVSQNDFRLLLMPIRTFSGN